MINTRELSKKELERLYAALADIDDPQQIKTFLEDLCTIREINEMASRLTVAIMLDDGTPYTTIQNKTGASATTISRVSKCLNYGTGGYRLVIGEQK